LETTIGGVWGDEPGENEVDVLVVRSTNFDNDGVLSVTGAASRSISERQLHSRELIPGDILLEKSGGGPKQPVGRVVLVREVPGRVVCSNFVQLLRPSAEVSAEWLFQHLWLDHANGDTVRFQRATTGIRNLKTKDYLARSVEVPPLAEQRRIADLLSALERAREKTDEASAATVRVYRGVLREWIDRADFPAVPMGDILEDIVGGKSPRCLDRLPNSGEWGVLKLSAVDPLGFRPTETKTLPSETEPDVRAQIRSGDVLITRSNTAERVGLVSYVADEPERLLASDLIWRLVPTAEVDPRYLACALSTANARATLSGVASGTSGSMKKLNRSKLRAISIPLPSDRIEQGLIADRLEAVRLAIDSYQRDVAALRVLRARLAKASISGDHEIPDTYDQFLNRAQDD